MTGARWAGRPCASSSACRGGRRAGRKRPGLSATEVRLGDRRGVGPGRSRRGLSRNGDRPCGWLLVVTGDAEGRQLLKERLSTRLRPGLADLRGVARPQLVLGHLRQVLDLRHARHANHRLLRRGRDEVVVFRLLLDLAPRFDRIGERRGDRRDRLNFDVVDDCGDRGQLDLGRVAATGRAPGRRSENGAGVRAGTGRSRARSGKSPSGRCRSPPPKPERRRRAPNRRSRRG